MSYYIQSETVKTIPYDTPITLYDMGKNPFYHISEPCKVQGCEFITKKEVRSE